MIEARGREGVCVRKPGREESCARRSASSQGGRERGAGSRERTAQHFHRFRGGWEVSAPRSLLAVFTTYARRAEYQTIAEGTGAICPTGYRVKIDSPTAAVTLSPPDRSSFSNSWRRPASSRTASWFATGTFTPNAPPA